MRNILGRKYNKELRIFYCYLAGCIFIRLLSYTIITRENGDFQGFLIVSILKLVFLCLRTSPKFSFLKLRFILTVNVSAARENKMQEEKGFTLDLLLGKKTQTHTNTFKTCNLMTEITRSNGCHWGKGLLVLRETDFERLGYRSLCGWSKGNIWGLFLLQLRKTVPFTMCHQKATMCLRSGKWLCWPSWRGWKGGEALGRRSDGNMGHLRTGCFPCTKRRMCVLLPQGLLLYIFFPRRI